MPSKFRSFSVHNSHSLHLVRREKSAAVHLLVKQSMIVCHEVLLTLDRVLYVLRSIHTLDRDVQWCPNTRRISSSNFLIKISTIYIPSSDMMYEYLILLVTIWMRWDLCKRRSGTGFFVRDIFPNWSYVTCLHFDKDICLNNQLMAKELEWQVHALFFQ